MNDIVPQYIHFSGERYGVSRNLDLNVLTRLVAVQSKVKRPVQNSLARNVFAIVCCVGGLDAVGRF